MSIPRQGLLIGAGYFSHFHFDAWQRMESAKIHCVCDLDLERAKSVAQQYGIAHYCDCVSEALTQHRFDFVDIATPPTGRLELISQILPHRIPILCQKPIAHSWREVQEIVRAVEAFPVTFMVHENFRFQPWYREIKQLLAAGVIGDQMHSITIRTRMGDGWQSDAYLQRQPYFRSMPRLLVHETGVHFIDAFRYLMGEIAVAHAHTRRLNSDITGEDSAVLSFQFENGAWGTWDASRYHESDADSPRFTFGELCVEANRGSIWMDTQGVVRIKPLGQPIYEHAYHCPRIGFAGDCVKATFQHFLDVLDNKVACETSLPEYLKTLQVVENCYRSAAEKHSPLATVAQPATRANQTKPATRRVIDLSLPLRTNAENFQLEICRTKATHGWNATTITMYSHLATHMDAPCHFIEGAATIDKTNLEQCVGPAKVINLTPMAPKELITVERFLRAAPPIQPGDRLLLRTDWHRQLGSPAYRNELPRISRELANWFVTQQVSLIGIEQSSVADVNNLPEVTEVHEILFRGGVIIVEALANLDQITQPIVEFIALPLNIVGGDGCPVRAIAIEEVKT